MSGRTIYFVVSWNDHRLRDRGRPPLTGEYGTASTKQAAIRLTERVLPPDAEYIIRTLHRTVHQGRTPSVRTDADSGRWPTGRDR